MQADLNDVFITNYKVQRVFFGEDVLSCGRDGVFEIRYHVPIGEGDTHFVDIYFDGGILARRFNPSSIEFGKE